MGAKLQDKRQTDGDWWFRMMDPEALIDFNVMNSKESSVQGGETGVDISKKKKKKHKKMKRIAWLYFCVKVESPKVKVNTLGVKGSSAFFFVFWLEIFKELREV